MEGNSSEDYGNGGVSSPREGISDGQRCQSIDSLAEWRSSEQVENGTPSTSPPFWDTDDDEDDCGPRPSELYGKFTWKIENFSQINKRELRSNAFEVGSYKWYILIYPQGCDVCNHLSLFLCVANHDKLLPGWSHFAQFTIAVVNKDPKKTKYSDTLHRFWKKEHDWGWKKFMELSKVLDGFINNDTLVIKAQVQVIREKANHLFRCLDCQYRREVLRVYLSNVEQICRTFFEDRKKKLCDLIGDKIRWSSFCTFWLEIDQNSRRRMSKEKSDTILRVVVKHFFVEKEVTSTLVMDSLYSGLKALECQSKNKKERLKIEIEESPAPMVRVDKDMFVLSDDVLLLLERVASDPLPTISSPPKDDKASQNRTKEGSSGEEFNKDSIERDERRLTELGRRTVEIFVLAHIFSSRIEVAYQEAVALKRQEELIREEEAAGQAENELKAKRAAAEKEKRTKKKQAKQKRNNRKSKDKQRDLKTDLVLNENYQEENSLDVMASGELSAKQGHLMNERLDAQENASDVSCTGDDVVEPHYRDLEDRASSLNWGMDASEVHPSMEASACEISNGRPGKMSTVLDDSSSTCSTDSVPSLFSNGPCKGNSVILNKNQTSPNRVNTHSRKDSQNHPYVGRHSGDILDSCMPICSELEADIVSLKHPIQFPERHLVEKQDATATLNKKAVKDQGVAERLSSTRILESFSASSGPGRKTQPLLLQAKQSLQSGKIATNAASLVSIAVPALIKEPSTSSVTVPKRAAVSAKLLQSSTSLSEAQKLASAPPSKDNAAQPVNAISRPSSAPLIPAVPKTNTPAISTGQVMPHLSRSVSAAGRFPVDPSSASSYGPQSYRNAIIGKNNMGSSPTGFTYSVSSSLSQASTSTSHSSTTTFLASMLPPPSTTKKEDRQQLASKPGFTFGSVKPEALHFQKQQRDDCTHNAPTSSSACTEPPTTSGLFKSNIVNDIERPDICPDQRTKHHQGESLSSGHLLHGSTADEFPHMDIINDLLDDEQSIMEKAVSISSQYHTHHLHHQSFSRQYSLPVDVISTDLGSISNSSGRFEQIDHYCNDGLQSINGRSFGGGLHRLQDDHLAQVDLSSAYASGQMDNLFQGQWPYSHADLSIMNLSSSDGSGYTYQHLSDYANMGTQLNGYGLYRP